MVILMNNIDVKKWKEFKIKELFDVVKTKNVTQEDIEYFIGDEIPYVTRTSLNNGVNCFIQKNNKFKLEKGNCITIGGEGAVINYQPNSFITGNNITAIYNPYLNENIGLFIVSILKLEQFKYSYNRAYNQKQVRETIIKLPAASTGEPDWQFMEDYIKSLKERERERVLNLFKY